MFKQTPKRRVLFVHRHVPVLLALFGVFSLALFSLQSPKTAYATTSSTINFQARLQNATGGIVPDGNYNVEFKLYTGSSCTPSTGSGCTTVWTEDYLNSASHGLQTVNGYLTANLGSLTSFGSLNWDQQMWLSMNIGGTTTGTPGWDGTMFPYLPLTAVPYALSAGQLQTTSGSNTSKLSITAPTGGNQTFVIQDQGTSGTFNVLTAPSGSDGYVKLQGASPAQQTGYFNISGTGIAGTLQAGTVDASSSSGTLNVGTSNAATVNIANNAAAHTIEIGDGAAVQTLTIGSTNTTSTTTIQAGTGGLSLGAGGVANTIQIGNTTGAVAQTVNLGTNATSSSTSTVNIGSTTGSSATNIKGGTGNITLSTNSSSASIIAKSATNSATAFVVQDSGSAAIFNVDTSSDIVTIGTNTTTGGQFINNGSTLNAALSLSDFPSGGSIGTAANTVNTHTTFTIGQTTASQTLTIPSPTGNTTAGRIIYIANTGSQAFTIGSVTIGSGNSASFIWNGSSWVSTAVSTGVSILGTFDSQTGVSNGATITGNTLYLQSASATVPGLVNTSGSGQTFAGPKTFSGAITASAGINIAAGQTLTNAGSTLNTAISITNPTNGADIGTNSTTVDVATTIDITETTSSSFSFTIPTPTNTTAGRVIYISNVGASTKAFKIGSVIISPNTTAIFMWNGSAWASAGIDGTGANYIQNTTSQQTGSNFNIDGTGVAATLQAGTVDATTSTGTLNIGTSNAGTVNIATNAVAHTIAIGNGAAVQSVTIGSTNGSSAVTIQGGTGNVTMLTNSSSASIVAKSGTNSATAFQVQNSIGTAYFNVDTTTGNITFGTGSNTVIFTPSGGLTASGTAQHTKTILLTPEYAGAVLDNNDTGGANCSLNFNGTMISGVATGITGFGNTTQSYYKWTTNSGSNQCYDVVAEVPIPSDFASWATTTPLTISTYTSDTTNGLINLQVTDTAGGTETSCNFVSVTPGSTTTWTASGSGCTIGGTYAGGGYMTIRIRMTSPSSGDVRIGNIKLNYKSNY